MYDWSNRSKEAAEYRTCFLSGHSFLAPPGYSLPVDICPECLARERDRVNRHLQRAHDAGAPASLTLLEWLQTLSDFDGQCAYCRERPFTQMEHFIPITDGGGTTADNCAPACGVCNRGKGTENPGAQMGLPGLADARREQVRAYLAAKSSIDAPDQSYKW
ncbi:MAG: HNH endonuclease [Anaerolineae bacterium]|nr:HNH endonuclease [Anaerolineae bacterium]